MVRVEVVYNWKYYILVNIMRLVFHLLLLLCVDHHFEKMSKMIHLSFFRFDSGMSFISFN